MNDITYFRVVLPELVLNRSHLYVEEEGEEDEDSSA